MMKKTSIVVMAIAFACALFVGQAFADEMKGDKEKWQAKETNRASEFIGKNVQNDQDEELGSVNDVLFNHKGQISYIILSRGGIAGIGEDLVPVPFKAEKLTIREDVIVLSMEKQKIDEAPSFSSGEWDRFMDKEFQKTVHGYYGMEKEKEMEYKKEGEKKERY